MIIMGGLSVRCSVRLTARFRARAMLVAGPALIGAGLAVFAQASSDGAYQPHILPP